MNWISVNDKYPPVDELVLAYHPDHGYYAAGWDDFWVDGNTMASLPEGITHWTKLVPPGEG